jgi:mannose-1-phosphate guanylyltransferase
MEKTDDVRFVAATFSWSDVGSFPALVDHLPRDEQQNAARGRVSSHAATHNVVWCEDDSELVALVGVDDLVVVRAGKRTLVAHKDSAEEIKKLVDALAAEDRQ